MSAHYLFAYGTLRRAVPNSMHSLLAGKAEYMGDAWISGCLYDAGGYPGLSFSGGAGSHVKGEVYRLLEPHATLRDLDDYEQCSPKHPEPHEYRRVLVSLQMDNGESVKAWCYEYLHATRGLRLIQGGDYAACFP